MDLRVLRIAMFCLLLCAGLVACGRPDSGEPREEAGNVPAEPKTSRPSETRTSEAPLASRAPASPTAIGEVLPPEKFDLRIIEVAMLDRYSYLRETYADGTAQSNDAFPTAGKFVVVTYSVRNTGTGPLNVGFSGTLSTDGGESFEESDDAFHPNALLDGFYDGIELQPRGLELGQFVFDVPADAEPVALTAGYTNLGDSAASAGGTSQAGNVDLTRQAEPGPSPEEVLALQYEYLNMQAWDLAYGLFAERTEELITEARYTEVNEQEVSNVITQYSFPSVEVEGNNATIERLITYSEGGVKGHDKATQEAVIDGGVWRLLMRQDQAIYFKTFMQEETTG